METEAEILKTQKQMIFDQLHKLQIEEMIIQKQIEIYEKNPNITAQEVQNLLSRELKLDTKPDDTPNITTQPLNNTQQTMNNTTQNGTLDDLEELDIEEDDDDSRKMDEILHRNLGNAY